MALGNNTTFGTGGGEREESEGEGVGERDNRVRKYWLCLSREIVSHRAQQSQHDAARNRTTLHTAARVRTSLCHYVCALFTLLSLHIPLVFSCSLLFSPLYIPLLFGTSMPVSLVFFNAPWGLPWTLHPPPRHPPTRLPDPPHPPAAHAHSVPPRASPRASRGS